jgi:hypothetical protein
MAYNVLFGFSFKTSQNSFKIADFPLFYGGCGLSTSLPKTLSCDPLGVTGKMTGMRVFMGGLEGWGKYEWGNIGGAGLFFAGSFGDFGDGDGTAIEGDFFALAGG